MHYVRGLSSAVDGYGLMMMIISCIVLNTQAYSATFIKPCKVNDKACLIASTQTAIHQFVNGIPELKIPTLDPMFIKTGKLDNENLLLKYTDTTVNGLRDVKVLDVHRDLKANTIKIEAEMPMNAVGQYDLDGKILFLSLYGRGDFQIKTNKAYFTVTYKIKEIDGPDGHKHWKISSFDYTYDVMEKVTYKLENLLGGNKESGKLIQEVLDINWKEIAQETAAPIIREIVIDVVGYLNKFFLATPASELQID